MEDQIAERTLQLGRRARGSKTGGVSPRRGLPAWKAVPPCRSWAPLCQSAWGPVQGFLNSSCRCDSCNNAASISGEMLSYAGSKGRGSSDRQGACLYQNGYGFSLKWHFHCAEAVATVCPPFNKQAK